MNILSKKKINKLPRTESPRFSAVKVYKKLQKTLTHHSTYPAEDCNHLSIHPPDKIGGFSASDYKSFKESRVITPVILANIIKMQAVLIRGKLKITN